MMADTESVRAEAAAVKVKWRPTTGGDLLLLRIAKKAVHSPEGHAEMPGDDDRDKCHTEN